MKFRVQKENALLLKIMLFLLCALLLSGCGAAEQSGTSGGTQEGEPEGAGAAMVYVPEELSLKQADGEEMTGNQFLAAGGFLYCYDTSWKDGQAVSNFYRLEMTDGEEGENGSLVKLPVSLSSDTGITSYTVDGDGNFYFFLQDGSLKKVDAEGNEVFTVNVAALFGEEQEPSASMGVYIVMTSAVENVALDGEGYLYFMKDSQIYLLDPEGKAAGLILAEGLQINSLVAGRDGKVYAHVRDLAADGHSLVLVDRDQKALGKSFGNLPGNSDSRMAPGLEKDFCFYDEYGLYEYDLETEAGEKLLDWLDCDIPGGYVQTVAVQDGKLMAVVYDWMMGSGAAQLYTFVRKMSSEIPAREEIVIGSLSSDMSFLHYAAVSFNKKNDKYHISIREYEGEESQGTEALLGAVQAMNMDLLSQNPPDLLDLAGTDIASLVAQGVLEDLTPYLEQSGIRKEDFLAPVLEASAYDGILTCIPRNFSLSTLAGRSALVGEKMGWSLEDLIALAGENPDAELFENADRETILESCLTFGWSSFIDWESGEADLDSEGFRKLLEFAAGFPEADAAAQIGGKSSMQKLLDGDILLYRAEIANPQQIMEATAMFGEEDATFVGYPISGDTSSGGSASSAGNTSSGGSASSAGNTSSGGSASSGESASSAGSAANGCLLIPGDACFGILKNSAHKEGAWAFLEFLLDGEALPKLVIEHGMSSRTELFEKELEEAMKDPYELDTEGQIRLDENGEPVRRSFGGLMSLQDNAMIAFYVPLEEDIAVLRNLLEGSRRAEAEDAVISAIVAEEAAAYFQGQKSVEDVSGIIQGRVELYLSERR